MLPPIDAFDSNVVCLKCWDIGDVAINKGKNGKGKGSTTPNYLFGEEGKSNIVIL
jgi:hypothetical protein